MAVCEQRDFARDTFNRSAPAVHPPGMVTDVAARRAGFLAPLARWLGEFEAEDVLQDAYVKLLTKRDRWPDGANSDAWFRRLLRNTAIDRLRRRQAELRMHRALWLQAEELTAGYSPDDRPRECACIYDVLDQIRGRYARILRRVDLEGGGIPIVAEELGITPNNARVQLHRARKAFRARLSAVCGVCAARRCLDCPCRRSDGREVRGIADV